MPRRHTINREGLATLVYAYGGACPLAGWEQAQAEALRQRALWNRLVELDREQEQRLLEIAGKDVPAIAELAHRIRDLSAQPDPMRGKPRRSGRGRRARTA